MLFFNRIPNYFYPLLSSLVGDVVISLFVPILVYNFTKSLSLSGLAYAMEWIIRIVFIPVLGNVVDKVGLKISSIAFDLVRIVSCVAILVTVNANIETSYLTFTLVISLLGGLIAVTNAQLIIIYEKYINEHKVYNKSLDKHSSYITGADQCSMVIGSIIILLLFGAPNYSIVGLVIFFYLINLAYFILLYPSEQRDSSVEKEVRLTTTEKSLSKKSVIMVVVILSFMGFFSNVIDGLVESSGVYIVNEINELPIEIYVLINLSAGIMGSLTNTISTKFILRKMTKESFLLSLILLELSIGLMLYFTYYSFPYFIIFYALCIGVKIPRITLTRTIRMQTIPQDKFAQWSSYIVSCSQAALPFVGFLVYLSKDNIYFDIKYLLIFSVVSLFAFSILFLVMYRKVNSSSDNIPSPLGSA